MGRPLHILIVVILVVALALVVASRIKREVRGGGPAVGVLFHGSPTPLETLKPFPSRVVDDEPWVFGTPSRWLALVFSAQARSHTLDYGFIKGKPYIAEMYPGAFQALKKPGSLHLISADGFRSDPRLGLRRHEFIRQEETPVIERENVPNIYEDLQRQRQQLPEIRFVPDAEREAFYRDSGFPPRPK